MTKHRGIHRSKIASSIMIEFRDAPNIFAVKLAEDEGKHISFMEFTKIAFPLGLLHLIVSTVYLFLVAFLFAN